MGTNLLFLPCNMAAVQNLNTPTFEFLVKNEIKAKEYKQLDDTHLFLF